jgi:AraC-like DNA-binding protein
LTIATIVVLLLIAILALSERTHNRSKYILVLLCISVCGRLVDAIPPELPPSRLWEVVGKFVSAPNIGLIWWFCLSIIDDKFRLGPLAWVGMLVPTFLLFLIFFGNVGLLNQTPIVVGYVLTITQIVMGLHIVWKCVTDYGNDLINARRSMRRWMAILPASILILVVISYQIFTGYEVILFRVILILPLSVLGLLWLTRFKTSQLNFVSSKSNGLSDTAGLPQNHIAYDRLMKLIENEKVYLEDNLSINSLAERIGIPSHQLRNLINQKMGYRNFSQFLAHYRIADIKADLVDPDKAHLPILTIALSSGFSSLTTFNRTFRSEIGMPAGKFRKEAQKHQAIQK